MSKASMLSLDVVPLEERHVEATAQLLAEAMDVDAGWRYLFVDARDRLPGLRDYFRRGLRLHLPHQCTYVGLDRAASVVATATLRPPEGINTSTLAMIRHGLLPFGLVHGLPAIKRLFWLKETYDAFEAELAGGRAHFHLHMMAVDPERQGQGIGGRLLESIVAAKVARARGVETVLTTHLRRNLPFYTRRGFQTRWERRVEPPGAEPYTVWGMVRPGHGPSA